MPAVSSSGTQATVVAFKARSTRTSPPPMRVAGANCVPKRLGAVSICVSELFISRALISAGEACGSASSNSAADPAIIGVAPEVPPKAASRVPVPAMADTDAPGAPISGLMVW